MSKNGAGSLGYQMMKALLGIFQPGASRHKAKRYRRDRELITGISTMRCMSADVHQFARFIRENWPEVKCLDEVGSEMALAYIQELENRGRSGGRIGRVCASIRKLDAACRKAGIFPVDAPPLLLYKDQGGPGGFHSEPRPLPYTPEQAQAIIQHVHQVDPTAALVVKLMDVTGLRVEEACYLKAGDIDLEKCVLYLNDKDNSNHTKGGRPRPVSIKPQHRAFLEQVKRLGEKNPSGHIFRNRKKLPKRARQRVRDACQVLDIPCLGTHGFRKEFANQEYQRLIEDGASDREALLTTSHQLGHNRIDVTRMSYIAPQNRKPGRK